MNAKILTAVVGILMVLPAGFAAQYWYKFPSCPEGDAPDDTSPYYTETTYESDSYGMYYSDRTTYEECAPDGGPLPPDLVTGHTVYAKWVIEIEENIRVERALGLPTDFAAVAGYFKYELNRNVTEQLTKQRECVVWFNGAELDAEPDPDAFDGTNDHFSDEDETLPYDESRQDYDFDRDVEGCDAESRTDYNNTNITRYGRFAVAVERGDCRPDTGDNFRYRGHLDFVDPNGIYHEVQEYDYSCLVPGPGGNALCEEKAYLDAYTKSNTAAGPVSHPDPSDPANSTNTSYGGADPNTDGTGAVYGGCEASGGNLLGLPTAGGLASSAVRDLFPWDYSQPNCDVYQAEGTSVLGYTGGDDANTPEDGDGTTGVASDNNTGLEENSSAYVRDDSVRLGHKCNGSIQDLFSERLWITRVHAPVSDPTIGDEYTFALVVDTCSGLNYHDLDNYDVRLFGEPEDDAYSMPGPYADPYHGYDVFEFYGYSDEYSVYQLYQDLAYDTWFDVMGYDSKYPGVDLCTDGSSFSFDDTNRGLTVHAAAPTKVEDIMRGNSIGGNATVNASYPTTAGKHREHCRFEKDEGKYDYAYGYEQAVSGLLGENSEGGWPLNRHPPGTNQETCYKEDHKTAQIDLYVYGEDPTGLFEAHAMTPVGPDLDEEAFADFTEYNEPWCGVDYDNDSGLDTDGSRTGRCEFM